jgi:ATP-dependent Clp protease ATP-binding subunit ClpC
MSSYNFTDRVRRCLSAAREEAVGLHHEYFGPEHILLGLLRTDNGMANTVLSSLAINPDQVRTKVLSLMKPGSMHGAEGLDLPYTSRAKKVLEESVIEGRALEHTYVGTEHLLLGILREGKSIGAQTLIQAGADLDRVRSTTLELLGSDLASTGRKGELRPAPTVSSARLALLFALLALVVASVALVVALDRRG